jgi:hypothetical protein
MIGATSASAQGQRTSTRPSQTVTPSTSGIPVAGGVIVTGAGGRFGDVGGDVGVVCAGGDDVSGGLEGRRVGDVDGGDVSSRRSPRRVGSSWSRPVVEVLRDGIGASAAAVNPCAACAHARGRRRHSDPARRIAASRSDASQVIAR